MSSKLTIVTGADGVDIGPAVAKLAEGVDDGLAVRIVDSTRYHIPHTSPDPYHRRIDSHLDRATGVRVERQIDCQVRLRVLPSAWQDPQTNLGVVFTHAALPIGDDLHTMASLGLDPSHRLTVQGKLHTLSPGHTYPPPVEPGNVGVLARDSVLRAGGRVVVEAGCGMPFLEALAALNLAPWAPWIGHLDLWVVVDAVAALAALAPGERLDLPAVVREAVDRAGGPAAAGDTTTVRVAVTEAQMLNTSERGQLEDAVFVAGR